MHSSVASLCCTISRTFDSFHKYLSSLLKVPGTPRRLRHFLVSLMRKMDKKTSVFSSVWPELQGAPYGFGPLGDSCVSGCDFVTTRCFRPPLLLASWWLLADCFLPHRSLEQRTTSALQSPGRKESVHGARVRAKLCSRAHVAWGGGRVGSPRVLLPKPEHKSNQTPNQRFAQI